MEGWRKSCKPSGSRFDGGGKHNMTTRPRKPSQAIIPVAFEGVCICIMDINFPEMRNRECHTKASCLIILNSAFGDRQDPSR